MAENSGINWTDNTFNPWIGCTKVSPACDFCYAETWDARFQGGTAARWGAKAARTRTSVKNWNKVRKWDRLAAASGRKTIVFCASLADVFDNHRSILPEWREDLWTLIRETPSLAWMLLTKRPQNIARYLPADWGAGYSNVALGISVENREEAARRIPVILGIPAASRFLSMEPLLEEVILPADALGEGKIDYLITGGESGALARKSEAAWFRSVRDQASDARISFLFKQWGEFGADGTRIGVDAAGNALDGRYWLDRLPLAA
ncbi:phage Gp37/Gp68 family protein [Paracoccus litorisediminis]|uniref:phage Gp37/Gp68 family protein n=1 Tax=Paracoccus litorisediminis TaxID=2006130 RepID=UPI003734B930